jgi:hypothetical protein
MDIQQDSFQSVEHFVLLPGITYRQPFFSSCLQRVLVKSWRSPKGLKRSQKSLDKVLKVLKVLKHLCEAPSEAPLCSRSFDQLLKSNLEILTKDQFQYPFQRLRLAAETACA